MRHTYTKKKIHYLCEIQMYCMLFLFAKSDKPTSNPPHLTNLLCGTIVKIASFVLDHKTIKQIISVI